jgi:hypothetical protein
MISIHIAEALWREGTSKPPGNASLESTAKTLIFAQLPKSAKPPH